MADQRIEVRPALGFEYGGNGATVGGICAEAVDGFRRKRDELAGQDMTRRRVNGCRRRLLDEMLRHWRVVLVCRVMQKRQ